MASTVQGLNLSKSYSLGGEQVHALDDVSLEVYPGEMVGVVGRTGAGKSTLLHTLGGFQRPDVGRVHIGGQDVTQLEDQELALVRRRMVGFLFQAFNLLPNETVLTNVEVVLRDEGLSDRAMRAKAATALQDVGLSKALENAPSQLSPRLRQYISMARALVLDPPVIMADEPTRPLDMTSREELMGLFQKLNDQGKTIIFTTPEASVANFGRRVVRMADGKIVTDELVGRRRVVPASERPGEPLEIEEREEETVCPRCNYGNAVHWEVCERCRFTLHLTAEEQESIEGRLRGAEGGLLGVESASDEGEGPIAGQELVEELKDVSFFGELGSKSLVKVIPALERESFAKGSTIVKQGGPADSFYILRAGEVEVVLEREGRLASPIATLGPKEGFGEMAILTDQPERSFTILAMTDVELWRLPRAEFTRLVSENLSLSIYFNRLMAHRLKALQEKVYL